jgi:soluble lytic murein transglycosylase
MRWLLALLFAPCLAASTAGDTLRSLSRRFLESPTADSRTALAAFAAGQKGSAEGSLANLVLGIADYQDKRYPQAVEALTAASERPTELADYAVYYRALAEAASGDHAAAAQRLAGFAPRYPTSPLLPAAARQRVESLGLSGKAREALALLPPSPDTAADWLLSAQAADRAGEKVRAVQAYQRVYYEFPVSPAEAAAKAALADLRAALGAKYPPPSSALRLTRADKLMDAGRYSAARIEYRNLASMLKGAAREQAAVRVGACDYHLKADLRARSYLKTLTVTEPAASAERLYYLAACARRLKRIAEFTDLVEQLGREHPGSTWHEQALFSIANHFLLEDEPERYAAYYRLLADRYPQGQFAASAHWKVAWRAYLDRSGDARRLLEDHLRLFPASGQRTAALYWLGRLAESRSDVLSARALYQHLSSAYPHYYYALLARERLAGLPPAPAGPMTPELGRLLAAAELPASPPPAEPPPEALLFLRRSRLLADLGLYDLADRELRFRADTDERLAFYAGIELAQRAADAGNHHQAIRYLKRYSPGYLGFPLDALPRHYWELLFPLPWRREIESYARLRDVDPYLVAALIRQESEFNPGAVSRARARGLMQIVLPTGRRLGRSLGITRLSAQQLHAPETSLRLGILHLRQVLDQYEGKLEWALAGYNAGEHRVDRWMTRLATSDPAEFVESIPFTETRTYVQAVLRNAAVYRRLYGG